MTSQKSGDQHLSQSVISCTIQIFQAIIFKYPGLMLENEVPAHIDPSGFTG